MFPEVVERKKKKKIQPDVVQRGGQGTEQAPWKQSRKQQCIW